MYLVLYFSFRESSRHKHKSPLLNDYFRDQTLLNDRNVEVPVINDYPVTSYLNELYLNGPRQANLVLIAYASSEGSGEPAHPRSLARTSAARSYKQ